MHHNTHTNSPSHLARRAPGEEAMGATQQLRRTVRLLSPQPASATAPPYHPSVRPYALLVVLLARHARRARAALEVRFPVAPGWPVAARSTYGPAPERRGSPSAWYPCRVPTPPCLPARMLSSWGHRAALRTWWALPLRAAGRMGCYGRGALSVPPRRPGSASAGCAYSSASGAVPG